MISRMYYVDRRDTFLFVDSCIYELLLALSRKHCVAIYVSAAFAGSPYEYEVERQELTRQISADEEKRCV
jgi:hypothetical protein